MNRRWATALCLLAWIAAAGCGEEDSRDTAYDSAATDTGIATGDTAPVPTDSATADTATQNIADTATADSATQDTTAQDTATQDTGDSATQDTAAQDSATMDTADSATQDSATQDTADSATQDSATQDSGDSATQDTADSATQDTADSATQDTATQDSATQDTADSATQDTATQDSATQDSATQDTATDDTADTGPTCVPHVVSPVARNGTLVLEFTDCTDTWRFAAVAQAGGRIVEFSFNGDNIVADATVDSNNYGSTFWTAPQSAWGWPPPWQLNDSTYAVAVDEEQHTITLSQDNIWIGGNSIAVEKHFAVDLDAKAVALTYTITNTGNSTASFAPWEITRVYPDGLTFFPKGNGSITSGTFAAYPHQVIDGVVWATHADITSGDHKLFADGSGGWLAHTDGALVFVKTFPDMAAGQAAPGEAEVEFYGNARYQEVEQQGPYTSLAPGQQVVWTVLWKLRPLPDTAQAVPGNAALQSFAADVAAGTQ